MPAARRRSKWRIDPNTVEGWSKRMNTMNWQTIPRMKSEWRRPKKKLRRVPQRGGRPRGAGSHLPAGRKGQNRRGSPPGSSRNACWCQLDFHPSLLQDKGYKGHVGPVASLGTWQLHAPRHQSGILFQHLGLWLVTVVTLQGLTFVMQQVLTVCMSLVCRCR